MDSNITSIIITVVSVLGATGAWKFYELLVKQKREREKEDRSEKTIYRDDLKFRVDKLEKGKDECMTSLITINAELAALRIKLEYIEEENKVLKIKLQNY
jgi:flagellar basal body-associated protein FliL|tara:strand:- start:417 stop:716 length:300 start_codon:yes stop_codon:yes gene_type:complete